MNRPPIFRAAFDGELVVDNFAGGGGASTGIEAALGRPVDIAINHSPEAIAMHRANHPNTKHFCEDIWQLDPRDACSGRPVGLAWFSPDCTHFSRAKGKKPRSKKIRGLANVVVNWARAVRPRVIMLENVEEFQTWGPLDDDNQPIPERSGENFRAWMGALSDLGYKIEMKSLVAADYGTPTTRKRLFIIARLDGRSGAWPEPTHGEARPNPWRTAAEIIDWSIPVPSIFSRRKPLVEKTLRRIALGIQRYVIESPDPFIAPFVPSSTGEQLQIPTLIQTGYGERPGQAPRVPGLDIPLGTVVAGGAKHALVASTLIKYHGGRGSKGLGASDMNEPIRTVDTQNRFALVAAFLTRYLGQSVGQPVDRPAPTVMPGGQGKTALTCALLTKYYGGVVGHGVGRPIGTVTAQDHHALTCAHLVKYYGTAIGCDLREPLDTVTGQGGKFGLITVRGENYQIVDIGMRMLQPAELFRAQGFPDDYNIQPYFRGKPMTKKAQIAMAGNAVCPQVAEALVFKNAS